MNGKPYTDAEIALVQEVYPHRRTEDIAELLGRSVCSVYRRANKLGLRKTPEFVKAYSFQKGSEIGAAYRFRKDHTPSNKGLRRPGWSPGRMSETQFKKGQRSGAAARNWNPVGTILSDTEGYLRIKVREAIYGQEPFGLGNTKVWPFLNRYLWEQHNGPIPPKHIVAFKDGDRSNCVIENLELLSMADNCRRNSIWTRLPRELAEAIQLNGALKRKIRRANGQEQTRRSSRSPVRDARGAQG